MLLLTSLPFRGPRGCTEPNLIAVDSNLLIAVNSTDSTHSPCLFIEPDLRVSGSGLAFPNTLSEETGAGAGLILEIDFIFMKLRR